MKKIYHLVVLLFTFLSSMNLTAQTLINQEWVDETGASERLFNFVTGGTDSNGNVIIALNLVSSLGGEIIHLAKYDAYGHEIWQHDYESDIQDSVYHPVVVTAITLAGSDIYLTGIEIVSSDSTSDDTTQFLTMRIDSNGNEIWRRTYAGAYPGPTGGTAVYYYPDSAYLYVCGSEAVGPADLRYTLIRYDSSGNEMFVAHYDSTDYLDIATGMIRYGSNWLFLGGVSGDTGITWDMTAAGFNMHNGVFNESIRFYNAYGYLNRMVEVNKNAQGEIYILGAMDSAGITKMRLLKMAEHFELLWQEEYLAPGSLGTVPKGLAVDPLTGNATITGTAYKPNGGTDMVTVSFDIDSALLWARTVSAVNPAQIAKGNDVAMDKFGNVYVTGTQHSGTDLDYLTVSYTPAGDMRFMKTYNHCTGCNDEGLYLIAAEQGMMVSGSSVGAADTVNVTVGYGMWEVENDIKYLSGSPSHVKNQVDVSFNPDLINPNFVSTSDLQFTNVQDVLPQDLIDSIDAILFSDSVFGGQSTIAEWKISKIYKSMLATDTMTISITGDTLEIPEFWATVCLHIPNGSMYFDDEVAVGDSLKQIIGITSTELNYIGHLHSGANDFQYQSQTNLRPTTGRPNAHINIEPAWDLETGLSTTLVGIYDSGLDWRHYDFCEYSPFHCSNRVTGGWDYQTNALLKSMPVPDFNGHGTACAGIIGAVRNNLTASFATNDIAGIAGGDFDSSDVVGNGIKGVWLAGMKVTLKGNGDTLVLYNSVADAIYHGVTQPKGVSSHTMVNVMNLSWGFDSIKYPNYQFKQMALNIWIANQKGAIVVASRGNTNDSSAQYPASYGDAHVITVGGSDTGGGYWPGSSYGRNVDVIAPAYGVPALDTANSVRVFRNTSASAPHVSGVAALLISYVNQPTPNNYNNLTIEDVEHLIEKSAKDKGASGYDPLTGHGLLDAGAAIHLIEKPQRYVRHFDINAYPPFSIALNKIDSGVLVNVSSLLYSGVDWSTGSTCNYINQGDKTYFADIYRFTCTVQHNLASSEQIVDYWTRPTASRSLGLPVNGNISPYPSLTISNVTQNSADLTVYTYLLYDTMFIAPRCWFPFNPNISFNDYRAAYSLLIYDSTISTVNAVLPDKPGVKVFPNPSSESNTLQLDLAEPTRLSVGMYDICGKLIRNVFEGDAAKGVNNFKVDISALSNGVYLYKVQGSEFIQAAKFYKF